VTSNSAKYDGRNKQTIGGKLKSLTRPNVSSVRKMLKELQNISMEHPVSITYLHDGGGGGSSTSFVSGSLSTSSISSVSIICHFTQGSGLDVNLHVSVK